jgi:hypothetical protein
MEPHKDFCMNQTKLDRLERVAFGDVNTGEIGDHQMLKEIHQILVEGNAVKKFIIKSFVAVSAIAALIYTFVKIDADRR